MLIKSDKIFLENLNRLKAEGYKDENPRPKYETDGKPAHTISINQVFETYDLSKGEYPFSLARRIAVKVGIKELLAIYQGQSNTRESFEKYGVKWWENWYNEEGNLGKAYPYNLESHRGEVNRCEVVVKPIELEIKIGDGTIIESDISDLTYLSNEEKNLFYKLWLEIMANKKVSIEWHSFRNFLIDLPYIPQFHLARETNFKDFELSPLYYKSDIYSKETCVFLDKLDIKTYKDWDKVAKDLILRYELSRNQVNELIKGLKNDPFGRRHITSFWNWANIDKKTLVECAYETIWSCRKINGDMYLDMTLIQRSNDVAVAGHINKIQYCALMLMVANQCGYKIGTFAHLVQNYHIYDRHLDNVDIIMERLKELDKIECKQPTLLLETNKDFYNITLEDFKILNYKPIEDKLYFELGV